MRLLHMQLLLLIGTAVHIFGLLPNYQYEYYYNGHTALGIPELRNQYGATGIEANVFIQMKTPSRAIVKISDVKSGVFNQDLKGGEHCVPLRHIPWNYSIPLSYVEQLETPFGVNFDAKAKSRKLLVPEGEEEFITNIRKSVVELVNPLPIEKLKEQSSKKEMPSSFTITEEMLAGLCPTTYLVSAMGNPPLQGITEEQLYTILSMIDEYRNFNFSTNSLEQFIHTRLNTKEDPKIFFLKRGVTNFEDCKDKVILKRSNVGNLKDAGEDQYKSVLSRSSEGLMLVAKLQSKFIVVYYSSNSKVLVNPYGLETEKLSAWTSRTALLMRLDPIKKPLILPKSVREVFTKKFEIAFGANPPIKPTENWINFKPNYNYPTPEFYMTGINLPKTASQRAQQTIKELLEKSVSILLKKPQSSNGPPNPLDESGALDLTLAMEGVNTMRTLNENEIEELFKIHSSPTDRMARLKEMLLTDVVAAAGTLPSIRVILSQMRSARMSLSRSTSIWITMSNHIISPLVIPEVMKYVMEESHTNGILMESVIHINFAALANEFCINPMTSTHSSDNILYGKEACNPKLVLEKFLPYMEQKLQKSAHPNTTAYLVQTLSNLGSVKAFSLLTKIVKKSYPAPIGSREQSIAVFGMERRKMGDENHAMVFDFLMEVFEDLNEKEQVRLSAFITMLTWNPEPFWWQHMAKKTWIEKSVNLRSFIAETIKTVAQATSPVLRKQAESASFAQLYLQPYPPTQEFAFNQIFAKYFQARQVDTRIHFEWIPNRYSTIPVELYAHFSASFGGFDFNIFEVALSSKNFFNKFEGKSEYFDRSAEKWSAALRSITHGSHLAEIFQNYEDVSSQMERKNATEFNMILGAFDHMFTFITKDKTFNKNRIPESKFFYDGEFVKFFSPISVQIVLPTDVGIPLIIENSFSAMIYFNVSLYSQIPVIGAMDAYAIELNQDFRISTKLFSRIKTFNPLINQTVMTGVDTVRRVNAPFKIRSTLDSERGLISFRHQITPNVDEKFPLFYGHTIPFTATKQLFPGRKLQGNSNLLVIYRKKRSSYHETTFDILADLTKLKLTLHCEGDDECPLTTPYIWDILRHPERATAAILGVSSLAVNKFYLDHDPQLSESKHVELAAEYLNILNMNEIRAISDYELASKLLNHSADSLLERGTRSKNQSLYGVGSLPKKTILSPSVTSLSACISFLGSQRPKQYALAMYYMLMNKTESVNYYHGHMYLALRHPMNAKFRGLDLIFDLNTPRVDNFEAFKDRIANAMKVSYKGGLRPFDLPDKKKDIARFKGVWSLSDDLRNKISMELNENCFLDQTFILERLNTELTYDLADLTIRYRQDELSNELLNMTYAFKEIVQGVYHPNYISYPLKSKGVKERIHLKAKRIPHENTYKVSVQTPNENIFIGQMSFPKFINRLATYNDLNKVKSDILLNKAVEELDAYCEISAHKTVTFDRFTVDFPVSYCPTNSVSSNNENELTVQSQLYRGERTLYIHIQNPKLIIFLSNSFLLINDKDFSWNGYGVEDIKDEKTGAIRGIIVYGGPIKTIDIYNSIKIQIRQEAFYIYATASMMHKTKGLCGNFDNDPWNDMIGSQGCIYNDPKLFGADWTSINTDEKCLNSQWLKDLKDEIKEFIKHCQKKNSTSGGKFSLKNVFSTLTLFLSFLLDRDITTNRV